MVNWVWEVVVAKSFAVELAVVDGVGKVPPKDGELIMVTSFAVGLVVVDITYVMIVSFLAPSHEETRRLCRSSGF